jgi:hypothetical protein
MSNHADKCPKWAEDLIHQIRLIEIRLGNLMAPPASEGKGDKDWQTVDWEELSQRAFPTGAEPAEDAADVLFKKVCRDLAKEGFAVSEIAGFVNARVVSPGSKLLYCSPGEVEDAL